MRRTHRVFCLMTSPAPQTAHEHPDPDRLRRTRTPSLCAGVQCQRPQRRRRPRRRRHRHRVGRCPCLPIVTGAYTRDTAEIFDHHAFDEEAVSEQARTSWKTCTVQVIKVGFVGSIENISAIAEIAADYADLPLIAYMPDLSWWSEVQIDLYLDAFRDLMLPQTTVLVGNHSTLCRWLLPDWQAAARPARHRPRGAAFGVAYTLVTGMRSPNISLTTCWPSPQSVLFSGRSNAGSRFLGRRRHTDGCPVRAAGHWQRPGRAPSEALSYLDRMPGSGFRPGMGTWCPTGCSGPSPTPDYDSDDNSTIPRPALRLPDHDTKH
jgi:hydroxymethylpyrimidine/phosphomethylpyrimidine kinase